MPDLYEDFVLRYDATDFLEEFQDASDAIGFDMAPFQGKNFEIYGPGGQEFEEGALQLQTFKNDVTQFVGASSFQNQPLLATLVAEMRNAELLGGLNAGLIESQFLPRAREILRLPLEQRLIALESGLKSHGPISGFTPRRIGINQDSVTGDEFLTYYRAAVQAQYNVVRLMWLAVIEKRLNHTSVTVQESSQHATSLGEEDFLDFFGAKTAHKNYADLFSYLAAKFSAPAPLNEKRFQKLSAESYSVLKATTMPRWSMAVRHMLSLTRAHPYAAALRGCLGDCSTTNAAPLPMAKKEEIYWIRNPAGRIKGYLQFTRLQADGVLALYVNTISGTEITRNDVRLTLLALQFELDDLGAKKIIIPRIEKFKDIINYPEVAVAFKDLALSGKEVPLEYLDAKDRLDLAPFLLDSLDQPQKNEFGIEIHPEQLQIDGFQVKSQNVTVDSQDLFPEISKEEAFLIALDLRNRESEDHHFEQILKAYKIAPDSFERFWKTISNEPKEPVDVFHTRVRQVISTFKMPIQWETFLHSPLLFRGHFAAPDALQGAHFQLALEYVRTYLTTLTELDYVYANVGSHINDLTARPEFRKLIQGLFRRNGKEMHRLLDSYELEYRSAYRTIIRLFEAGLPLAPFENEIKQLNLELEESQDDPQIKESVYVRRKTLLGIIDANPLRHFNDLMDYLEKRKNSNRAMDVDDLRVVSNYFAAASNSKWITSVEINRINQFILGSEFGLSFTASLGMFKNNRLAVPQFVDALFEAHKYLWAAYLIHKNPWPKHPRAATWLKIMWQNKDDIGIPNFIDGIVANPSWLEVKGVDEVINGILKVARDNVTDETLMARVLMKNPKNLTAVQLKWLSEMSTPGLIKAVLAETRKPGWPPAMAAYLQKKLEASRKVMTAQKQATTQAGKTAVPEQANSAQINPPSQENKAASEDLRIYSGLTNLTFLKDTSQASSLSDLRRPTAVPYIKAINVFSGVPQQAEDVSKPDSGGFGDVAANFVAALEIKKLHPDVKVRLIVTSAERRYEPIVPTTNEIIKIMVPHLDSSKKGVVQNYKGIEVIFLDCDFAPLLKKSSQVALVNLKNRILNRLTQLIPSADLNLNFSNYPDSEIILRINASLALGIEENYGSNELVDDVLPKGKGTLEGAYATLRSGPTSMGFMMSQPTGHNQSNSQLIESWAEKNGLKIKTKNFRPLLAYASEWQATQIYLYALAAHPPPGPTVLFMKDAPELDVSMLPPNIEAVFVKGMPHEVMSALIQDSYYSPLITGDISLGQALSYAQPGKTFVYEARPWKVESAARLRWLIASQLNIQPNSLADMFLLSEQVEKMNQEQMKSAGMKLSQILVNPTTQNRIYGVIKKMAPHWDVIDNTLTLANEILREKQDPASPVRQTTDLMITAARTLAPKLYENQKDNSKLKANSRSCLGPMENVSAQPGNQVVRSSEI